MSQYTLQQLGDDGSRYNEERLRKWERINLAERKEIVARERQKVFEYRKWASINDRLFGPDTKLRLKAQIDGEDAHQGKHGYGGEAESPEHRRLKEWVVQNPLSVGVPSSYGIGKPEYHLLSGDKVDVMFSKGRSFRAIEVKSSRSSDSDMKRGIYQCVKYREVKLAEQAPFDADVKSILVTERTPSTELKSRAKLLGVVWKCVTIK